MSEGEKEGQAEAETEAGQPLACRILCALAEAAPTAPNEHGAGMSLPRLGKRLGHSASVLVRELAFLGDAPLAGQRGPGWVQVEQKEGRWTVHLTAAGLAVSQALAAGPVAAGPEAENRA